MSDCLEMWRDLSTYEANFVNSQDISVVSRLANVNLEITKTLSRLEQINTKVGRSWIQPD